MKPRLVLLYTRDRNFDRVLKEALLGTRAVVLIARNLDAVRKIVLRRGRELDLAILDFNQSFRGMTVLNALNGCYDELPTVAVSSEGEDPVGGLTLGKSARVCLSKPFSSAILAKAIANLCPTRSQTAAPYRSLNMPLVHLVGSLRIPQKRENALPLPAGAQIRLPPGRGLSVACRSW